MSAAGSGRVAGKVALVTGAASGIGLATSRMLAGQGALVAMADIALEPCEEAARELRGQGLHADACELDVTDEDS